MLTIFDLKEGNGEHIMLTMIFVLSATLTIIIIIILLFVCLIFCNDFI